MAPALSRVASPSVSTRGLLELANHTTYLLAQNNLAEESVFEKN